MRYVFLFIGLVLTLGAMANSSLLYVGLVFMLLSFVFTTQNESSISKIEERKSLIDKLDKVNLNVPDNALSSIVSDIMTVTAKMQKGAKAELSAKNLANGTINVLNGVESVFKNK